MSNKFYTIEPIFKEVSETEFKDFIRHYPRKLERDVYGVCDPPLISYNDFELANRFPASIVASTHLYSDDPNDYYYEPKEKRVYEIMTNYKECFENKTGYKE